MVLRIIHGFCCSVLLSTLLEANAFAEVNQVALGKKQYQLCSSCHGQQGHGNKSLQAPAIAGLPAWYTLEQLTKFKSGIRGKHPNHNAGLRMHAMARMLSKDNIEHAAAYVETMKPGQYEQTMKGDPVAGKQQYVTCAACHGQNGGGNKILNAPPLVNSNDWYLYASIMNYRGGRRAADSQLDPKGYAMVPISKAIPNEKAIADVVAYIQTFNK